MRPKYFYGCFVCADCDCIGDVAVKGTIVTHAVFQEELIEVVKVDGH